MTVLPEAILARDRDLGLNSSLVYSLPGARSEEGQRLVSVDPRTGALRLERNVTEDTLRQPLTLIVQVTSLITLLLPYSSLLIFPRLHKGITLTVTPSPR